MHISMQLGRQAIEELIEIYEDEFGDQLSNTEAQELGLRLLRLLDILLYPTPDDSVWQAPTAAD